MTKLELRIDDNTSMSLDVDIDGRALLRICEEGRDEDEYTHVWLTPDHVRAVHAQLTSYLKDATP
jgi:hypothetical protein